MDKELNDKRATIQNRRSLGSKGTVFLEANPFASRLHVLGPMIEGAVEAGHDVYALAPERETGTDFVQFQRELPSCVTYVNVRVQRRPLSTPRITLFALVLLLGRTRSCLRNHGERTLVLTAIDDYFLMLPIVALLIRVILPGVRVIVLRYRVTDLVGQHDEKKRQMLKGGILGTLDILVGPDTAIFDERVPLNAKRHLLPDPWTGPFGSISRSEARQVLEWKPGGEDVLLVGFQDERKGFDVAVEALKRLHASRPNLRVTLVGKVSPALQPYFEDLANDYRGSLKHVSNYVSDEELSLYFAASTVVLLPYHTAFTSTSGVLVRAAASATPVVASDHGLVGWRTIAHSLGKTFTYPNYEDLCQSLADVLDSSFDASRALDFARGCTSSMLSRSMKDLLNG